MKKLIIYIAVIALIFTACKDEEKATPKMALGDFDFATEHLTPGQTVDVTYNGTSEDVEGTYYYMVNNQAYPMDLNLSENKASVAIPDSAQAVAFNFKIDGKYDDNNKKGYLIPLKNNAGENLAGSKAALAIYAMNYGGDFGVTADKAALFNDIKDDITKHPELKEDWNTTYLNMAYRQDKTSGEPLINDYIESTIAKTDMTEDEYASVTRLYNTIGKKDLAEAMSEEVKTKFPNGKMAQNSYGNKFYEAKDLDQKEAIFKEYTGKFKTLGNVGNYMVSSLARAHADNGDMDKFNRYANIITDKSDKAGLYNSVAWPLVEKGEDLDTAAKLSKQSLDLMTALQKNPGKQPNYYTENQYKESLVNTYNMYADTYALIQFKQGNMKEAISYQEQAIGDGKNGEMNERYIEFLMADKQYDVVVKKAETFIEEGNGSPKLKDYYKEAFLSGDGDAAAFDSKLTSLEKIAHTNYVEEIKKSLINDDAPTFTLKNTDGQDIALASLKGKTVILDFWATWCGPCKASFPGMQEVVTKYKDDEDVVLLFVDTFEDGSNREKLVTDFIAKNEYDFHVVYDNKVDDSNDFEVADKYGVTGIPTKVIIDGNGKIRFKSVGYGGQTDKLVKEMDIMIEILKS